MKCCIHNFVESSLARLICLRSHYHCQFWCLIKLEMTDFILLFQQLCWIICQQTDLSLMCNQMIIFSATFIIFHWKLDYIEKDSSLASSHSCVFCPLIFLCLVLSQLFPSTAHGWQKNNPIFSIFLNFHFSFPALLLMTPIPRAAYIARTDGPPSRQT